MIQLSDNVNITLAYDQSKVVLPVTDEPQECAMHFHKLMYLGSPRARLSLVLAPSVYYKGYLSSFRPQGMDETGAPFALVEITPINKELSDD